VAARPAGHDGHARAESVEIAAMERPVAPAGIVPCLGDERAIAPMRGERSGEHLECLSPRPCRLETGTHEKEASEHEVAVAVTKGRKEKPALRLLEDPSAVDEHVAANGLTRGQEHGRVGDDERPVGLVHLDVPIR
jgi:hypothetical protein